MLYDADPYLLPYRDRIDSRRKAVLEAARRISPSGCLSCGVNGHLYYGLHRTTDGWVIREWAPNASRIYLVGVFNNWKRTPAYQLQPVGEGNWELHLPEMFLRHGDLYKLFIEWPGGGAERLPAYVRRVVQDPDTKVFCAQVWEPAETYVWKNCGVKVKSPLIYECHIGMSSEEEKVASFDEFRTRVLPRIASLGYNTVQIMALQEHPYYGSFGYQVSNFFALSSRFGTPEQFKALVDEAHGLGLAVVMDMVQSHSVANEAEGLGRFDGREDLYFYPGAQGWHPAWGSRCFDYGKDEVIRFLLSCCKFWMEEYRLDGFRFDGVTSMLYYDHGLGRDFCGYEGYFDAGVDENAVTYLGLAARLVGEINPDAILIAEDVSGFPGLAAPPAEGGLGFGFRMAMGIADHWIKWIKECPDEQWSPGEIWYELTNKRADERTISYCECHDRALVGDKTLIFRLVDKEMYTSMQIGSQSVEVDRGVALHKMIRLSTLATAGDGYLTFMGNEFGHPEWIDFPREGNGNSYKYARRQWSLADAPQLRYGRLQAFDKAMIALAWEEDIFSFCPQFVCANETDKVLSFTRGRLLFAFNFSPSESFADYGLNVPEGIYRLVLDSDEGRFDGFARIRHEVDYPAAGGVVKLYLPARTALVLKRV